MKRKILIIVLGLTIISICIIGGMKILGDKREKIVEIEPEEEISEEQERQTIISLYFINKNSMCLEPEARMIDVKKLINNPYTTLLEMLINGPENNNLESIFAKDTKIKSVKLENDCLKIDFSEEFIKNIEGKEKEELLIKSIVNTMTELNEVNGVEILIEGEAKKAFLDNQVKFDNVFSRE